MTGIKEDEVQEGGLGGTHQGETFAVLSLIRLSSLLEKLPVLEARGREVSLIAESLQVRLRNRCVCLREFDLSYSILTYKDRSLLHRVARALSG